MRLDELSDVAREPDPDDQDLFDLLPEPVQAAVARGELDLEDVYERITRPGLNICPHCGINEIPESHERFGICPACVLRRSTDLHRETVSKLDALRENNVLKKAVSRRRQEMGVAPRGDQPSGRLGLARQVLTALLADGPQPAEEIHESMRAAGFHDNLTRSAANACGVVRYRTEEGPRWELPEEED